MALGRRVERIIDSDRSEMRGGKCVAGLAQVCKLTDEEDVHVS